MFAREYRLLSKTRFEPLCSHLFFFQILAGVLFILGHGQKNKKRFTAEKRIRI